MRLSPASQSCQVRRPAYTRAAAAVCDRPAASLAALMFSGAGLLAPWGLKGLGWLGMVAANAIGGNLSLIDRGNQDFKSQASERHWINRKGLNTVCVNSDDAADADFVSHVVFIGGDGESLADDEFWGGGHFESFAPVPEARWSANLLPMNELYASLAQLQGLMQQFTRRKP